MSLYSQGFISWPKQSLQAATWQTSQPNYSHFPFWIKKMELLQCLSLPTPLFSKVCIYIHVNCGLLIISNKKPTYQEPKDFYSTCEQLDSGISWRGTHPCSSSCSKESGHHCINTEVCGDVKEARAMGFAAFSKQVGYISCSQVKGRQPPSHSSLNFQLFPQNCPTTHRSSVFLTHLYPSTGVDKIQGLQRQLEHLQCNRRIPQSVIFSEVSLVLLSWRPCGKVSGFTRLQRTRELTCLLPQNTSV